MSNKELEIKACKIFVCPNMQLIDEYIDTLFLKPSDTEKYKQYTKKICIAFFKKTYEKPIYTNPKNIIIASIYIANRVIFWSDTYRPFTQDDLSRYFNVGTPTIRKYCDMVYNELNDRNGIFTIIPDHFTDVKGVIIEKNITTLV